MRLTLEGLTRRLPVVRDPGKRHLRHLSHLWLQRRDGDILCGSQLLRVRVHHLFRMCKHLLFIYARIDVVVLMRYCSPFQVQTRAAICLVACLLKLAAAARFRLAVEDA